MKNIALTNYQSPGDVLMMTAAVRDLHRAHAHRYHIVVSTSVPDLWLYNPYVADDLQSGIESVLIQMAYPLIHRSNREPVHFLSGFRSYLEEKLDVVIPASDFKGDIHLSEAEKNAPPRIHMPYWIIVAGGKYDFTAKWYNPASLQKVVDHFQGKIQFVQCGEKSHWHPRLDGVIDMVGKTTIREFIQLMYHADGVVCPVTFAMHLAAAVEMPPGRPKHRPCVVLGGGREPPHWEAYPFHQYISTVGMLPCCDHGGCWRSRCQLVGDGDEKDRVNVCEWPVQITPDLRIPQCMEMIRPEDVIRRIEMYLERANYDAPAEQPTACGCP